MPSILSVSQLNKYISLKIGSDLKLKGITIRGELSDFKIHYKSGHAYFTLKDEGSVLKGVMFSRSVSRLAFSPQSGMSVLCSGNVEVYEAGGVYQIICTEMLPMGIGIKFMQLEAVKEKLAKQGVFAQENKKVLPDIPKKIAVVTSLNGAALQDVLNILGRRYPIGSVDIFPAQVQGETAKETIVSALNNADSSGADVIILARGGGSFEDLAPFNTEEVALAISACKTPVISAVGHETDTTLADYAADVRAPTPSAAAEICAPTLETMLNVIDSMQSNILRAFEDCVSEKQEQLDVLETRLKAQSPDRTIVLGLEKLNSLSDTLSTVFAELIYKKLSEVDKLTAQLDAMSPFNVLERGYAIAMKNNSAVTEKSQLSENDEVLIRFKDFAAKAVITGFSEL